MKWGEVGKLFAALDKHGCRDLVIIGTVTRPDLAHVKLDFGAIKNLPFLVSLGMGGDDHVLSSIVRFLEGKGYRVHGADDVAPELLAAEGVLGKHAPSADDRADIALGFEVVQALGALDVGQAAVVAKGYVVAVEAAEGTDAMLERCAELRRTGRARGRGLTGVLVKAPKPGQEERVDLPTIGPETVTARSRCAPCRGCGRGRPGADGRACRHHRGRGPPRAFPVGRAPHSEAEGLGPYASRSSTGM